jgi:hypothetical protein
VEQSINAADTATADGTVGGDAEVEDIGRLRRRLRGAERRGRTVALARHARDVGEALACGTHPRRRYWGDCFRRAAEYMLDRCLPGSRCPPQAGLRLVHGTGRTGSVLWAHAWVELPGGLVFDGVRQRFYDRADYGRVLGVTAEAIYQPLEVVDRLRATQRYGPWHRGVLGAAAVRHSQ